MQGQCQIFVNGKCCTRAECRRNYGTIGGGGGGKEEQVIYASVEVLKGCVISRRARTRNSSKRFLRHKLQCMAMR